LFLGYKKPEVRRIADTQKCLRVSGKHNDLEEVGRDAYHHTMFEMLGNWSFGDYFKQEAIDWAWELLTKIYGLNPDRIYASVFEGDETEGLAADVEAANLWKKHLPENHILYFDRKDNFWEMGDTGPCGPCSELHYDMRTDEERLALPGENLVNVGDPRVVEIWNLVFIQFNRKADGSLEELPEKHVDTGMGFERLCRALQGKESNYDTDIFSEFISKMSSDTGIAYTGKYDNSSMTDIAMRVIADHLRAVSFAIADGEMPGNNGAAYVIRRILRRAIRYNYSFLNQKEPYIYSLVPMLAEKFKEVFPELFAQKTFVERVILEEEKSFLKTLEGGLKRIETLQISSGILDGHTAFELYDTFGFPIDLTRLIGEERNWTVDEVGFNEALQAQKNRSRTDAKKETGDWVIFADEDVEFVGYDQLEVEGAKVLKYRTIKQKGEDFYQLVLNSTPFYPEGGGQVGDTGFLVIDGETYRVINTKKENDLAIHYVDRLPDNPEAEVKAVVDAKRRALIENNHSVTHLMHAALRKVLGTHVSQKGSLVKDDYMRFDFAHFSKMTDEEIDEVERIVNEKIRQNIPLQEDRSLDIAKAKEAGAMMLFGEKYGDKVRMITFDPSYSRELCGGCHVDATGKIGLFKIKSESAIAAGVRRIEVLTAASAEEYVNAQIKELSAIKSLFKTPLHTIKQVETLQEEVKTLRKELEQLHGQQAMSKQKDLVASAVEFKHGKVVKSILKDVDSKIAKTLAHHVLEQLGPGVIIFGLEEGEKCQLMVTISEELTKNPGLHAGNLVRNAAKHIGGGGGGQANFATAGGKEVSGLQAGVDALFQEIDL
ncbi:MAG TPA: alanine--tRNA ligase, partial [Saprospiraceae bacterium]|nr:alanine--tRNA ligase [Saprospiraceae bacterium]